MVGLSSTVRLASLVSLRSKHRLGEIKPSKSGGSSLFKLMAPIQCSGWMSSYQCLPPRQTDSAALLWCRCWLRASSSPCQTSSSSCQLLTAGLHTPRLVQ
eukprot:scpid105271/ scgid9966/ 